MWPNNTTDATEFDENVFRLWNSLWKFNVISNWAKLLAKGEFVGWDRSACFFQCFIWRHSSYKTLPIIVTNKCMFYEKGLETQAEQTQFYWPKECTEKTPADKPNFPGEEKTVSASQEDDCTQVYIMTRAITLSSSSPKRAQKQH